MKLRIRENTLRFRLGRSEVETFDQTGAIGDNVRFGLGKNAFGYVLEKTPDSNVSASFAAGIIVVRVPASDANTWASSDEVSLAGTYLADEHTEIRILIEKDFVCLNAQTTKTSLTAIPTPKATPHAKPHDTTI